MPDNPHPTVPPLLPERPAPGTEQLILWLDFETTGPDPTTALPLEVAFAVTDARGELAGGSPFTLQNLAWNATTARWRYPDTEGWRARLMQGTSMHESMAAGGTGLVDAALDMRVWQPLKEYSFGVGQDEGPILSFLLQQQAAYSRMGRADVARYMLGGKNPQYDRAMLARFFPFVYATLVHYRNVDVKLLEVADPQAAGEHRPVRPHRAMDDVVAAVSLYRAHVASVAARRSRVANTPSGPR